MNRYNTLLKLLLATCVLSQPVFGQALPGQSLDCLLEPNSEVDVGSPVFGILDEVRVDRGDTVTNGQVIASLRSDAESAGVKLAEARAMFNRRKVERNDDLYRDELISLHEKDEIETQSLISNLELLEAQERLDMRTVRSPLTGVVVERLLSPGEYVQEMPILRIAQINPLNVEAIAPVALFGSVSVGDTARLTVAAPLDGEYAVKVTVVDRVIDAASGTFGIRFELANPGNVIPSGMNCTVYLGSSGE